VERVNVGKGEKQQENSNVPGRDTVVVGNDDAHIGGVRAACGIESAVVTVDPILLRDDCPACGDLFEDLKTESLRYFTV
jgi:hypothetical protein